MKRKGSMLLRDSPRTSSHYHDRLTPPSIASNSTRHARDSPPVDYTLSKLSKPIVEDILDLRLKLAL